MGKVTNFKPLKKKCRYDFWKFYQENTSLPRKERLQRYDFFRLSTHFSRVVGEHLVENKAGVYLKKLGYLAVFLFPKKIISKQVIKMLENNLLDEEYNQTQNLCYYISFHPISWMKSPLAGFSIENSLGNGFREKLHKNIKKGYRYKLQFKMLDQFYGNGFSDN